MLAWRVDGGPLGRRQSCCRFPAHLRNLERTARAERSDRTCTPNPRREQGLPSRQPAGLHRTTKHQAQPGATSTGPGGYHNRRPTGGVLPYSKLMRCNDYPTSAAPADATREANHKTGFLGKAATRRRRREERAAFEEGPRLAGAGSAGQPVWPDGEQERHDWRPRTGAGNRCAATVGNFAAPRRGRFRLRASDFCRQTKVTKSWLRGYP